MTLQVFVEKMHYLQILTRRVYSCVKGMEKYFRGVHRLEVEANYKFHRNDHVLEEFAEEVYEAIINIDFKFEAANCLKKEFFIIFLSTTI